MKTTEVMKTNEHDIEQILAEQATKTIVGQIKKGDKQAFGELVELYRNQVAALAYKMVGNYDEAADVTQNVFVKISQNIGRYDESKKFYTWLYRITVNASIDYMRKHRRHHHESIEEVTEKADDKNDTPELSYQRDQLRHYINEAAESLNDKQRSAFMLRDMDGCHIDDVANIMNMPEATVRWYIHRARAKIKKELLKKCPQLLLTFGFK
ncbi:MAG: sigma-70 family RNA polymerase sigma factor [candidate division Zixibacteria bacterium]|nr:sigma-70 family RNA polymerase sigma factor [candidate division Zixibacteria bacterium]